MVCLTDCSLFYLKEKNKLTLYKQLHTHKHFDQINIRRGNQNSYIEEGQTMRCPKENDKKTNNDLQNIHIKLKIDKHEPN